MALTEKQRSCIDPELIFPRIKAPATGMVLAICAVTRFGKDQERVCDSSADFVFDHQNIHVLARNVERETFVVVLFDPLESRSLLISQFRDCLKFFDLVILSDLAKKNQIADGKYYEDRRRWIQKSIENSSKRKDLLKELKSAKAKNTKESNHRLALYLDWLSNSGEPASFKKRKPQVMAARYNMATLWLPIGFGREAMEKRFLSTIKNRRLWTRELGRKYWEAYSSAKKMRKSASIESFWIALAAWDAKNKGVLQKQNVIGEYVFGLSKENPDWFHAKAQRIEAQISELNEAWSVPSLPASSKAGKSSVDTEYLTALGH